MRGHEQAQNNYTFYLHPLFLIGLENSTGTITLQRSKYCSLRHIKVTVNFLKLNNKFRLITTRDKIFLDFSTSSQFENTHKGTN